MQDILLLFYRHNYMYVKRGGYVIHSGPFLPRREIMESLPYSSAVIPLACVEWLRNTTHCSASERSH